MLDDKTAVLENDIQVEKKGKFLYLIKLLKYVFSSAKGICSIFIFLAILLSLLRPLMAFIWGKYIDSANSYSQAGGLVSLVLLITGYYVVNFISGLISKYIYAWEQIERLDIVQSNRFQEHLDTKLYDKISRLPPEYMEVPKINDIIARSFGFSGDAMQRDVMIQGYIIIAKLVSIISIGLSLYFFNPFLYLIILIAPIPTLYTTYIGSKLSFKFNRDNNKLQREAAYYQGLLLGSAAKEIKALNLFDFTFKKWKTLIDEYTEKEKKTQLQNSLLSLLSGFIANMTNVSANVFAIVLMAKGQITLGALGAVLALISTLISDTSSLFSSVGTFLSKKNDCAQFFELIDLKEQKLEGDDIGEIESINIKDLHYRYPLTEKYILNGVDLKIKKGEKIAFVGENGAGKTTFIKILTGMIIPSKGEFFINGNSMENADYGKLYARISAVYQDPARYNTFTAEENVMMGDPGKAKDETLVDRAIRLAGFEGVDKTALLGKDIGGTDLSGGQWQKLAIARAYYREKDFIILDEPTSNLDPVAEADVFRKYMEMAKDKTVIIVTHRISVAALADRVIVFSDGKITEDGTHDELIGQNGKYSRLYETQAKWYNR